MFKTAGRLFSGLTRVSRSRGSFVHECDVRLNSIRLLTLSCRRAATSKPTDDEEEKNEPVKFSTSKAGNGSWAVDQSLGSKDRQPLRKVLPLSLIGVGFILWCILREETGIDAKLERQLHEHVPGLLSDDQQKEVEGKKKSN